LAVKYDALWGFLNPGREGGDSETSARINTDTWIQERLAQWISLF